MTPNSHVNDDKIVITVDLGELVVTCRCSIDPGITQEKRESMSELSRHVGQPAAQITAERSGLRVTWADGFPFVFKPPAWETWWGGRPPAEAEEAVKALAEFEAHLYGNIIGTKIVGELSKPNSKKSLWAAIRDFPPLVRHSQDIQMRLQVAIEAGETVSAKRGERSPEHRRMVLDRWMATVSRVEEFHRLGYTYEQAFEEVARAEGRGGADPGASVRRVYKFGRRWQKFFGPNP